jgi:tRNA threonylcarbamoyladenosine biosynthesis protein TsaB
MRVLALDTTTRAGSVALVEDDRVIAEREGDATRTHAQRLPGEITDLFQAWGILASDVDLFAVAVGPGSFTGLRIGIATIQGLALVGARPVAPISALEALAQIGSADEPQGAIVGVWMDALRRDVFSALYRVGPGPLYDPSRLVEIEPPAVGAPVTTLERWRSVFGSTRPLLVGDGAVRYGREALEAAPAVRLMSPAPLGAAIGRMAIAAAQLGRIVHPAGIQPLYVRRPDAEVDRERRK